MAQSSVTADGLYRPHLDRMLIYPRKDAKANCKDGRKKAASIRLRFRVRWDAKPQASYPSNEACRGPTYHAISQIVLTFFEDPQLIGQLRIAGPQVERLLLGADRLGE